MTSNHHAPYDLGHTRATMDGTEGSEGAMHTESFGKYGKAESRLPGKASSTTHIGPYRKWTHMGKERILR